MVDKLGELVRFQQVALSLRASRQELLASNVANADTPNYKARDIDFASALQAAMAGTSEKLPVVQTAPTHLEGRSDKFVLGSPVMYRKPLQSSADGNTVEMDFERAQIVDNALRYEASVAFVSSKFKTMLAAIQG